MFLNLIIGIIVGLIVGLMSASLIDPRIRFYPPYGWFLLGIIGALIGAILIPGSDIFEVSFILLGTIIMSFLGSLIFILIIALFMSIFIVPKSEKAEKEREMEQKAMR